MRKFFLLAALALSTGYEARAWDPAGHMLVGQVAWNHLSPKTRKIVADSVLMLPSEYNNKNPYNFVTSQCWMDDMRSSPGHAWSKLHYVNVAWSPNADAFVVPPGENVVNGISSALTSLAQGGSPKEQAQRLAFLVHFIGDVHQPLHACERAGDKGGNGYLVYGVPFTDLWPGTTANLHALWDKAFRFTGENGHIVEMWRAPAVEARPPAPGIGIIAEEAGKLEKLYPVEGFTEAELTGTGMDWARESYNLACKSAYPPGEPAGDTGVNVIPPEFAANANAIAGKRIVQAGLRMARTLEVLFSEGQVESTTTK